MTNQGFIFAPTLSRDKASLDVFWVKDASMTDLESLPEPAVLVDEITEHLRSALDSFEAVNASLTSLSVSGMRPPPGNMGENQRQWGGL